MMTYVLLADDLVSTLKETWRNAECTLGLAKGIDDTLDLVNGVGVTLGSVIGSDVTEGLGSGNSVTGAFHGMASHLHLEANVIAHMKMVSDLYPEVYSHDLGTGRILSRDVVHAHHGDDALSTIFVPTCK